MTPAAEHDFGGADESACGGAEAVDAVFADADDGQPARRCGSVAAIGRSSMKRVLILGGTTEAR